MEDWPKSWPKLTWTQVADAEYRQPNPNSVGTGKRMQIVERGRLSNAGFYGLNEMKATFKTKTKIDSDEATTALNTFKQGQTSSGRQYLQVFSAEQGPEIDIALMVQTNKNQAITIEYKAESTAGDGEEDAAQTFGTAMGALAVAISALAF